MKSKDRMSEEKWMEALGETFRASGEGTTPSAPWRQKVMGRIRIVAAAQDQKQEEGGHLRPFFLRMSPVLAVLLAAIILWAVSFEGRIFRDWGKTYQKDPVGFDMTTMDILPEVP